MNAPQPLFTSEREQRRLGGLLGLLQRRRPTPDRGYAVQEPPALYILGTRGVPAAHGGFETFAERFALYMHEEGWRVTVYCQTDRGPARAVVDTWRGIRRVTFAAGRSPLGTMKFDWNCVRHASRERGVMLVLGYNTAVFSAFLRLAGLPVLTNMDGIEWKRGKWPFHARLWLYLNEWIGAVTSTRLVADHPEIARHHARRRSPDDIVMLPYGADPIEAAPEEPVLALRVEPGNYLLSIGRIEPENNVLPMIQAYMSRPRSLDFVCLGKLNLTSNAYHAAVFEAGKGRVIFPGAIYEKDTVRALRFHAAAYCHGHSVGGTNPSLVEALGAGNAIVAHDNPYNRWVAGAAQFYFSSEQECATAFEAIEHDRAAHAVAQTASRLRFHEAFQWEPILEGYRELCEAFIDAEHRQSVSAEPDQGRGRDRDCNDNRNATDPIAALVLAPSQNVFEG